MRRDESIDSSNIVVSSSKRINQHGGEIILEDLGISLKVPTDALTKDELVTMTVDTDEKHVPLEEGQLVIGPVISCTPDDLKFLKPVTISVPHSCMNISIQCIQVWCKNRIGYGSIWEKIFDGTDAEQRDVAHVLVEGKIIKFRVSHFTLFDVLTAPVAKLVGLLHPTPTMQLDIWAYLYPVVVEARQSVLLKVYALNTADEANKRLVEQEENKSDSGRCATPTTFIIKNNGKNLMVRVRDILPQDKWVPESAMEVDIPFNYIQCGGLGARCEIKFKLKNTQDAVNRFEGALDLKQEDNPDSINGLHFYDKMAQRKQKAAIEEQHLTQACDPVVINQHDNKRKRKAAIEAQHLPQAWDPVVINQRDNKRRSLCWSSEQPPRMPEGAMAEPIKEQNNQTRQTSNWQAKSSTVSYHSEPKSEKSSLKSNNNVPPEAKPRSTSTDITSKQRTNNSPVNIQTGISSANTESISATSNIPTNLEPLNVVEKELQPLLAKPTICRDEGSDLSTMNSGDFGPLLKTIARGIQPAWKEVALALNFTEAKCHEFVLSRSPSKSPWWPAYMMLHTWKNKLEPRDLANYRQILSDAVRCVNRDLAEQILM